MPARISKAPKPKGRAPRVGHKCPPRLRRPKTRTLKAKALLQTPAHTAKAPKTKD